MSPDQTRLLEAVLQAQNEYAGECEQPDLYSRSAWTAVVQALTGADIVRLLALSPEELQHFLYDDNSNDETWERYMDALGKFDDEWEGEA